MLYYNPSLWDIMSDQDATIVGNNNVIDQDMDIDINVGNDVMMDMDGGDNFQMTDNENPIIEPMQERVVNRTIMHNVPHVW